MPKKGEKNRKRRTRQGNTTTATNATQVAPSRRTPVPKRTTKNSSGNRGSAPPTKRILRTPAAPTTKKNGKRYKGAKRDGSQQEPTVYTSETGETYKPGDHAYVDSQQSDLPFHICVIKKFTMTRKDSIIAEVKWFYRVSELPESVYSLLMDDRKEGSQRDLFADASIASRELFVAFNDDTHPASLFKGKCSVKNINDIPDLGAYVANEDHFFHCYGYKPESRRLTDLEENSLVPASQQAILPDLILKENDNARYANPEESAFTHEELTWKPQLKDEDLLMYLRAARSIALHAGVYMNGYLTDGCLAASSDETTQLAFDTLHKKQYDIKEAVQELVKSPVISSVVEKRNWSKENALLFAKGMRQFGKNFYRIKKELLPKAEICELIGYYYLWKKTNAGLSSRTTRRQRKQTHIRLGRASQKPPSESPPKREFMDWASEDEAEMTDEGGDKHHQGYYVCHHCFITVSPDWHHAGMNRRILCHDCRLYYQKYGCLVPLTVKREPPEFVYRDFHDNQTAADDQSVTGSITTASGRKTRNSNGSRLVPSSRPGLRSGKNYCKSDTEEEVSDSSEESSFSLDEIRVTKPKVQARRSILDNLDETVNSEPPPLKRTKRLPEGNDSDPDDSETTSGGDGGDGGDVDHESKSTKSGETGESSSLSSAHSSNMEGDQSPGSGKEGTESTAVPPLTTATSVPSSSTCTTTTTTTSSQFVQVCKDREMLCSRTDLVYVHPPQEERRNKVCNATAPPVVSQSEASTTPSTKVTITPHAPQLPVGPSGPLPGFYNSVPYDAASFVRRDSQQEQEALFLQYQQQWLASLHQRQMEQIPTYTPLISHTGHIQYLQTASLDPNQQQHFSFPTPEEMARNHRLQWQEQMLHNSFIPVAVERQSRPDDPVTHLVHPITNMDALFQQPLTLGIYPTTAAAVSAEALELRHRYEMALQWIQKDPSVYQLQQVQQILVQYQQYQQQIAMTQQLEQQQQQQTRMLQELMGQQRDVSRSHPPHDDQHNSRVRPGVIVQPK